MIDLARGRKGGEGREMGEKGWRKECRKGRERERR